MSLAIYTVRAIECDYPDCFESVEGLSGEPAYKVLRLARERGWVRDRLRRDDRCPGHRRGPTGGKAALPVPDGRARAVTS